jgi:5'-nucleotidase / UDP-sugar diphosphatase
MGRERPLIGLLIKKEHAVKFGIPAILVSLLIATGCQQQASKPMTDSAALDVSAAPAPVAYSAPAPMPMQTMTPDPALSSATPAAGEASGKTYTIQKGDTLWKIATSHYGDGKKWHEIADANPGLSPSALRVGETISLP